MDLDRQYDNLYRYCYRRLRDRALAEDVTQEAIARLLAQGPAEDSHALRWLYTVARNLCTDELRRPRPEPLAGDLPDPAGRDGPADSLALRLAVASLTEEEQELILMRYVNQEPVSLIAAHFGVSRFALRRRTAAVLEKLRRALEEDEP